MKSDLDRQIHEFNVECVDSIFGTLLNSLMFYNCCQVFDMFVPTLLSGLSIFNSHQINLRHTFLLHTFHTIALLFLVLVPFLQLPPSSSAASQHRSPPQKAIVSHQPSSTLLNRRLQTQVSESQSLRHGHCSSACASTSLKGECGNYGLKEQRLLHAMIIEIKRGEETHLTLKERKIGVIFFLIRFHDFDFYN